MTIYLGHCFPLPVAEGFCERNLAVAITPLGHLPRSVRSTKAKSASIRRAATMPSLRSARIAISQDPIIETKPPTSMSCRSAPQPPRSVSRPEPRIPPDIGAPPTPLDPQPDQSDTDIIGRNKITSKAETSSVS
jgi:hypothetical protein